MTSEQQATLIPLGWSDHFLAGPFYNLPWESYLQLYLRMQPSKLSILLLIVFGRQENYGRQERKYFLCFEARGLLPSSILFLKITIPLSIIRKNKKNDINMWSNEEAKHKLTADRTISWIPTRELIGFITFFHWLFCLCSLEMQSPVMALMLLRVGNLNWQWRKWTAIYHILVLIKGNNTRV